VQAIIAQGGGKVNAKESGVSPILETTVILHHGDTETFTAATTVARFWFLEGVIICVYLCSSVVKINPHNPRLNS
jgi:hypothetical protein